MNLIESQRRRAYIEYIRDKISGEKFKGLSFSVFINRIVNIRKYIEDYIEKTPRKKSDNQYNSDKAKTLYYDYQLDKKIDEHLPKKIYNAFYNRTAPEDDVLHSIQVLFSIDMDYSSFCSKLDKKIPDYLKYLKSSSKSETEKHLDIDKSFNSQINENPLIKSENISNNEENEKIEKRAERKGITEKDVTEEQRKKGKKKNPFRMFRNTAIISIFIILFSFASYQYFKNKLSINKTQNSIYSNIPFDTTKAVYNVLLFPFQPLEMCQFHKTNIELAIISRLFDMSDKDSLNLQIKYDTLDCIHSSTEAESIGKKLNANLVIWGDLYEHCTSVNEACLKFVNISSENTVPGLKLKGESGIEKMSSLSEIKEGKLQRNIDYIIYWVAASSSYNIQNFTKALYYFKKIETNYTVTCELYSYMGSCCFKLKSYKDAKIFFEKALEINPNMGVAHNNYAVLLGDIFYDFQGAKEHFEKALKNCPNNDVGQNNYAYLLGIKLNDLKGAKEHFKKALVINPNNPTTHYYYAYFLDTIIRDKYGAKEHYELSLKIDPNNAKTQGNYATLLFMEFNDIIGAKEHYELSLKIDPNNAQNQYNYAYLIAIKFNDKVSAEKHYLDAIRLNPKLKALDKVNYFFSEK